MSTFEELANRFRSLGIECSKPGFYDDLPFRIAEDRDPSILQEYASFVDQRPMSPAELEHAHEIVPRAAAFLFERLMKDGRLGACVDASMVLSRILEQQGVWNYVTKGALTVSFAPATGLKPVRMGVYTLPGNPAVAGHAWVCAPPYRLVDITVSRQPYPAEGRRVIGRTFIVEKAVESASAEADDLFDPDAAATFRRERGRRPTMADAIAMDPDIIEKIRRYGAFSVRRPRVAFKYVGAAMGAPDLPLDKMENLRLSGKLPFEIYRDFLTR